MLSMDASLLLYAFNTASPWHKDARAWLTSIQREEDVAVSELILAELYGLLRNPAVLKHPLPADEAVDVIQSFRTHPRWRLIGFPIESRPLHDTLWQRAGAQDFAFRKLDDTRSALTMTAQGMTDLATVNVKDFGRLGFRRVWNPLTEH